jgi:hypothetical protein
MPLPDPHASEPTTEVDRDTYKLYEEAKGAVKAWTTEMVRLKKKLIEEIGDAYAATIDGEKVLGYRPKDAYAEARLRQDYPDLTEHFVEVKVQSVFNMDRFAEQHPDIAAKYRIRALVELDGI